MQITVEALIVCLVCIGSIGAQSFDKYSDRPEPNEDNANPNANLWVLRQNIPQQKPKDVRGYGLHHLFERMYRNRRKFPEVDSKGFNENIFDEGFGGFSTMKKRSVSA